MSPSISAILFLLSSTFLISTAVATVPFNNTFKFVNAGDFGEYINEYDASYRPILLGSSPFQYCFYNTTPNAYTFALRMATARSESVRVWVWEANRGNPVGENAVFSLLTTGNLVLAEADGRIAWQSNTADKGVVGYDTLANGNLVLYNAKKKIVWQSFDSPTDTLLVDQYLKLGGATKLVSRASRERNVDGPYSLVMEPTGLAMYYTSPVDSKRYQYFSSSKWFTIQNGQLKKVTLSTSPKEDKQPSYEISLVYETSGSSSGNFIFSRAKYNPIFSYMRLEMDGNLKIYIYDDNADWGAWETTFTLFSRDSYWASECELPSKCGGFGLCTDNQCVGCPTGKAKAPKSQLVGWNKNCTAEVIKPNCSPKAFHYYQLAGVDHFSLQYTPGEGPMTQEACAAKCTNNCKCPGFFYHKDTQKCWVVSELKTLISVDNKNHLAFIKTRN